MILRRKLLAAFAATVLLSVVPVVWIVSVVARRTFERANEERTAALVAQFRREFNRRGEDIGRHVESIAGSEEASRIALALSRGSPDYGAYLNLATTLARNQQLDFLEFVNDEGTIISSAQWPAKFGYKDKSFSTQTISRKAFLKQEDLADRAELGLFSIAATDAGGKPLYVIGGRRLDQSFLASLELPAGMRAMFYRNLSLQNAAGGFSSQMLIAPIGSAQTVNQLAPLIEQVQQQKREASTLIRWSPDAADDETVRAIPLTGQNDQIMGILLIGDSRRPYVEFRQHIRTAALLAGSAGLLLAVLLSGWAAARVSRPVEQLVEASHKVAEGDWSTQVPVTSRDELGDLAESFNQMTRELLQQKERLVQAERVAAWRDLARRLAHELKNPLFPLQLTVENLLRARQQSPEMFEEIFAESSSTLLAEIAHLKTIVSRFSDFSKMPLPHFQPVGINEIVRDAVRLFQARLRAPGAAAIECKLNLAEPMSPIAADPDLLHRTLSNLLLNAMDAMPQGGTIILGTRQQGDNARIEVSDTGVGLTPEECERLFTPYYTTKSSGTGLGLAIVQSIISDHGGRISVRSQPGQGTTFEIELPRNLDKLDAPATGKT
jgi:two-component system nitrogen regulation sensor histidine kinase NtrY